MPPPNSQPRASLVLVTPQPIRVGERITVDASGTTGANPPHKWSATLGWGDAPPQQYAGFPGRFTKDAGYATEGTKTIVLGVTDPKGRTDGAALTVEILPAVEPPPVDPPPVDTGLVPWQSRTTWAPGVPGGVPERPVYLTIEAAAGEMSDAIQVALGSCPPGHAVLLSSGVFQCNNFVRIPSGVTLRGSSDTILRKTNGAHIGQGNASEEQEPIVILAPSRWPHLDETTAMDLLSDGQKGDYVIVVHDASGFAAGQYVLIDQDDYTAATWCALPDRNGQPTTVTIWASDTVVFAKHNPPDPADDPFPDSLSWFSRARRPVSEIKQIASVTGNVIRFTTPLHMYYRTVKDAQIVGWAESHVVGAGLEDLRLEGGSDHNVIFNLAAECWIKNVEPTQWIGEGVSVQQSFRCEIRDSFVHDCTHPYPGGAGYGIGLSGGSSEILIENSIVVGVNKCMVAKSAGAGSVVGYNYMDNAIIGNYLGWVEVGVNGSHMVGPHHILFEGNQSHNYDSDDTHGSSFGMTIFRNHLVGRRRDYPNVDYIRCAGAMFGSWWHAFIGNVLGEPRQTHVPWALGYAPSHWEQAPDPKVLATCLRDGNFDYVSGTVQWDRPEQPLPDSLYLTARPAFFTPEYVWPWVDPLSAAPITKLPARERYELWQANRSAPAPV